MLIEDGILRINLNGSELRLTLVSLPNGDFERLPISAVEEGLIGSAVGIGAQQPRVARGQRP